MRLQVNKSKDSIKKLKFSSNSNKKFKELKINKVAIDKSFEEYSCRVGQFKNFSAGIARSLEDI